MSLFGRSNTETAVEPTVEDKKLRMVALLQQVNDAWRDLPRGYKLWIDWDTKPPKVVLVSSVHIERNVVGPL